jgi:hypothetical protein
MSVFESMTFDDVTGCSTTHVLSQRSPGARPRRALRLRELSALIVAAVVLVACDGNRDTAALDEQAPEAAPPQGRLRYDTEYPTIGYSSTPTANRVARLGERLVSGGSKLEFRRERGYLDALLEALDIDSSTQMLVFSKTSLQSELIGPETPRAIFFNDDTYVAYVQDAANLEIATMDSELGPVFYTLAQNPSEREPVRQLGICLRCHDSYSLTGGGVPRFITGSGYIATDGSLATHEGWILTSDETAIRFRWGGWYVSGRHGAQVHLGNFAVHDATELEQLEQLRIGNVDSISELIDTSPYPTEFSDIVALLVLEHQTYIQNLITRVRYDIETLISRSDVPDEVDTSSVVEITEPLVRALFFVDAAQLTDRITGSSGFTSHFESLGPADSMGRSLRTFNLRTRLFEYPLSYLVYSDAFESLPSVARRYVADRIAEILSGRDTSADFSHLSSAARQTIAAILRDTKPELVSRADAGD